MKKNTTFLAKSLVKILSIVLIVMLVIPTLAVSANDLVEAPLPIGVSEEIIKIAPEEAPPSITPFAIVPLQIVEHKVGSNLLDATSINNFQSFGVKFNREFELKKLSDFGITYEYSLDGGTTYLRHSYIKSFAGMLVKGYTNDRWVTKKLGNTTIDIFAAGVIDEQGIITHSETNTQSASGKNRFRSFYDLIENPANTVMVRTVLIIKDHAAPDAPLVEFILDPVTYSGGGQTVSPRGIGRLDVAPVEVDIIAPVLTLKGDNPVNIPQNADYVEDGWDIVDADPNVTVAEVSTIIPNTEGTYTITYTATDSSGNISDDVVRTVIVGPPEYLLELAVAGVGGTVNAGGRYVKDTNVTVIATPDAGYLFDGWYKNGTAIAGAVATYTFPLDADYSLEARFSKIPPLKHQIVATTQDGGTIIGAGTYNEGTVATLVATPDNGYAFEGWYEAGVKVSSATTFTFTIKENRTLEARFYRLVNADFASSSSGGRSSGGGGSIGTVNVNTTVTAKGNPIIYSELENRLSTVKKDNKIVNKLATLSFLNKTSVEMKELEKINKLAEKDQLSVLILSDNIDDKIISSRLAINPKLATKNILLTGSSKSIQAQSRQKHVTKWFENETFTYSFDQKENFGQEVSIAIKLPDNFAGKSISIYNYDAENNMYNSVNVPYRIDRNGYIHFTSDIAGTYIFSIEALVKK